MSKLFLYVYSIFSAHGFCLILLDTKKNYLTKIFLNKKKKVSYNIYILLLGIKIGPHILNLISKINTLHKSSLLEPCKVNWIDWQFLKNTQTLLKMLFKDKILILLLFMLDKQLFLPRNRIFTLLNMLLQPSNKLVTPIL